MREWIAKRGASPLTDTRIYVISAWSKRSCVTPLRTSLGHTLNTAKSSVWTPQKYFKKRKEYSSGGKNKLKFTYLVCVFGRLIRYRDYHFSFLNV